MSHLNLARSHSKALSPRAPAASAARARVSCFSVVAAADPGVMPRLLELFAKRNIVPQRWHSDRLSAGEPGAQSAELSIDVQVEGLTPELTDYIARCMEQLPSVLRVLTSEKFCG